MVGAALAAWLGAGSMLVVGAAGQWSVVLWTLTISVLIAIVLAAVQPASRAVAVPLMVVLIAAGTVAVLRISPLVFGPLPAAAADKAYVSAMLQLTGDPVSRPGQVQGSQRGSDGVAATATLVDWTRAGVTRTEALPIRLMWSGEPRRIAPGTMLRVSGRLLPGLPLARSAALLVAEKVEVISAAPESQQAALAIRESLRHSASAIGGDAGALLPGLVLGDTSAVSEELAQAMRDSGLSHLTAVSGGNVAVTLAMVWWVARRFGAQRRMLVILAVVALPSYVLLVRPDPSVLRAAVMAALGLVGFAGGLRTRGLPMLALATTLLLLFDPFLAYSVGFALSVVATGGLVLLGHRWSKHHHGIPLFRQVLAALGAAAAASLATAPLIAGIGGGVPLLSIPANLLAAPAVAPAGIIGLLAALSGLVAPWPSNWLTAAAAAPAGWIAAIANWAAGVPGAVLPWPQGWIGGLTLAAVLALVGLGWWATRYAPAGRPIVATATVVVLVLAVAPIAGIPLPGAPWPPPGWLMVACDVGQGDGLVLNAGAGAAVVVDTGPDPKAMDRCLARLGIRNVPVLLLSHEHADHVEGVPGVLRGRSVGKIVVSPLNDPLSESSRVRRWAAAAEVPVVSATAGEQLLIGSVQFTVLWPDRLLRGTDSDPNNASLVLYVRIGGITMLLGGDIQPEAQQVLLRDHPPGHVDIVKVPHHGSRKQDTSYAIDTHPLIALISCGVDNDYGHPAPGTVRQYQAVGAAVGRTDTSGDLVVVLGSNGKPVLLARGKS